MKPITAWIRGEAINDLIDLYGSQLQRLTEADRREFLACLALGPDLHSWGSAWDEAYRLTKDLNRYEQDKLMEAIAASLVHSGNPWLETARVMSEIEQRDRTQKTSTPAAVRDAR